MSLYIGIDPGALGGMAVVENICGTLQVRRAIPFSISGYVQTLKDVQSQDIGWTDSVHAVVEDVHAMPGQGVTSMFSFGRNKGLIEGMLLGLGIDYRLVSPQTWKKHFGLIFHKGTDKREIKSASIDKAVELFPDVNLLATKRCVKPHDGMAEACLMAKYCYDTYKGN